MSPLFRPRRPESDVGLILHEPHVGRPLAGMRLRAAGDSIAAIERALTLPERGLVQTMSFHNDAHAGVAAARD